MVYDRPATDVFCAVAFIICVIAWFGILGYSISKGNPQHVFAGVDGDHKLCGTLDRKDYPLLLV
jgi:hypothetical protein